MEQTTKKLTGEEKRNLKRVVKRLDKMEDWLGENWGLNYSPETTHWFDLVEETKKLINEIIEKGEMTEKEEKEIRERIDYINGVYQKYRVYNFFF